MSIVLINPGSGDYEGNLNATTSTPPLGLLYIASKLIGEGHKVTFIDQPVKGLSNSELINKVKKLNPDYVGLSVMVCESTQAGSLSNKLKNELPNTKIIWGGPQPTFCADRIMSKYPVDYCIRGPGEDSISSLINGEDHSLIPGIVYRENGLIKNSNQPVGLIKDIDKLPFPARELVLKDIDKYGSISGFSFKKCGSIISSRGCPYSCTYCSCNALTKQSVTYRSVDNVIKELELMVSQGYKNIIFFDDSLTLNERRVMDLSDLIRKEKLDINWIFEGRVNHASRNMFKSMVKSGCKFGYFGAESGVQRMLDLYNKKITTEQTINALRTARESGIDFITASFIIGGPGETEAEINQTIKFIKSLAENYVDFFQVAELMAYPGTVLWNDLVSKGYINPDEYWEDGRLVAEAWHDNNPSSVSPELLHDKLTEAYSEYIYDKRFMARHLSRAIKSIFSRDKWRLKQAVNNISRILSKEFNEDGTNKTLVEKLMSC